MHNKLYGTTLLVALLAQSCQVNTDIQTAPATLRSNTEIDAFIRTTLQQKGDFRWAMASDELVWSALRQSDGVVSVGYKPAGLSADLRETIHTIDIQDAPWQQARQQLLDLVLQTEQQTDPTLKAADLVAFSEETLPVLDLRVKRLETIQQLRASGLVRYVEPMGYQPGQSDSRAKTASSSGCGSNIADIPLTEGADYTTLAPGTKSPWNHPYHGIRDAWSRSTGAGTKILLIDTGLSDTQDNLGSAFNQGSSTGRTIEKRVTLPKAWFWSSAETPNDGCGHGTAMAGAMVAPRGTDGAAMGVAYNASLVSVRAATDVFLDESREMKGVADAYILAGNRDDIKITSMSLGTILYNSQVADAIRYAFNKGKLMFCAGGTSFGWSAGWTGVIFPASMSEVQAITGIQDNLSQRCETCHEGAEIDFVVVMEKAANRRHIPTLAMNGNPPSTVGGSSVATATTAGMAALVWSQNPTATRAQILDRLSRSASNYPNRSSNFGWGRINVNAALTAF
ncbi:S8 family serine peptidase [Rudanella paleaurantiibacter]|uniref:S8 family serine peptidase n=1 Tax=Rudanella paleaurantiibacter TaxID=2614655 RepID=A0A7J5U449_9BACT|nr:S8/S53 family peptidase [Rudanella paleaurantiibacter]KAB7732619.1 S8 family serine peptidase [Rudanella paleaurantiibacter]